VAYSDYATGRVVQGVEDLGKLAATLIIYISGDNGASPEGALYGTPNGTPNSESTYPHMSVGWAWALDTRFRGKLNKLTIELKGPPLAESCCGGGTRASELELAER
jgi:arylsulfatase A-like enzyme